MARWDGHYVAYDESQFVVGGSNGSFSFKLPAGERVIALVDDQGRTAVTSPTIQTKPGGDMTPDRGAPRISRPPWRPASRASGGPTAATYLETKRWASGRP